MILVLIGYMGSGKSTLGKVLANKLNYSFIDLDDFIEEQEKSSISDIFKTKGEIYFRRKETEYLKDILNNKQRLVLSVGGGTPCYTGNMQVILDSENATGIYLKASIPTLVKRLQKDKSKRPLISHIKTEELLTEFIGKHLFERSPFYRQAQVTISIDHKTEKDIIEELIFQLF